MAGKEYLEHDGTGGVRIAEATQVGGSANANKIAALDANGRLDETMMPTGIGADTATVIAAEALAAGDFVSIINDSGTAKVRKANATDGTLPAVGFVRAAVTNGSNALVYFEGNNDKVTGQTPGRMFLSAANAGKATATAPSGNGNLVQRLGVATSATNVNFEKNAGILL